MRTSEREILTNAHLLIAQFGADVAQDLSVRKIMHMERHRDVLGMVMWQRVSAALDALSGKEGDGKREACKDQGREDRDADPAST